MSKTHSYFDLFVHIKSIPSVEVAAQAAQSTAWKVDAMIVAASRQLYRDTKEHLFDSGIDERAELSNALNELAYAEQSFHEIGSSMTGPISTIKQLMYVREAWHALAAELTPLTNDYRGRPRTYEEKTIEDQICTPGLMQVNKQSKAKMKIKVTKDCEGLGMPALAAEIYAANLKRKEGSLADVSKLMESQAQGVMHMFALAQAHPMDVPDGEPTAMFYSLSLDIQEQLINNCINAITRAVDFACDNNSISESAYTVIYAYAKAAGAELKSVLKSPRFVAAAQQEAAVEHNLG